MSRESERISWLILTYRVPGEPGRLRSRVWRRLKAAGAVYLTGSVAALPASPAAERLLRRLRSDITRMGGSAQLLRAGPLAGGADLVRLFNAARDDEYAQIIAGCDDLMGFASLEQGERELARLTGWYEKALARDAFGASQAESAATALAKCRDALTAQ
jgi:DNA-binding transcriptional regulator PaaX